ncbi:MAG: DEAD/DEAH box helicase [Janthinobacterium lividum]
MPFPDFNAALTEALAARNYAEPTPVQSAVLVDEAEGRDLLVSAQTGSGKTVAFGLAFAPTLLDGAERFGPAAAPLALVIAPTRELAIQVKAELTWLYGKTGARIASAVGGMDARAEARALSAGAHIVVGTPGRLKDHTERKRLDLSQIRVAVLDEADEMLDMGFKDELEFLLDATPPERRTLLFSATIPKEIAFLAKRYQRNSLRLDVGSRNEPHGDIEYRAITVAPHDIERAAVNVLRYFESGAALVFCATREAVRRLQGRLLERGFDAVALSGELSQHERNSALQSLRDGRSRVCVCTDVAARGLDLPALDLVVHADLPRDKETMLHRSGRTGRAGRKGVSVVIVPFPRKRRAEMLFASAAVEPGWSDPPSADLIAARDNERLLEDKRLAEELTDEDKTAAQELLEKFSPEQLAAAVSRFWRAELPAPEDGFAAAPQSFRSERVLSAARERTMDGAPRDTRRPSREPMQGGVWFRVSVGRKNNADPKWLIPLICRQGNITKAEIGSIRIFDSETKFEILPGAAAAFTESVGSAGAHDPKIEPALPPGGAPQPGSRPRRPTYRE